MGAKGNANVISDAATALYLTDAALKSALVNVNINLKFIKDKDFVAEWTQKRDELQTRAASRYAAAHAACETALEIGL